MGHTLLHQVLVSDLVVPILLAEAPEHRSLTQFGARPSERTWLRPDLVVARREQFRGDRSYVLGVPLLVAEVTSEASMARDLGAKKDLWARIGVPSYWVVHLHSQEPELYVFELADGRYAEQTRLGWGESLWVTEPFKIELSTDQLFDGFPRKLAANWRGNMTKNSAPGLPPADEEILADVFGARWPTGTEKAELEDGCPVFYGTWDERDVEIAQRTYPGRVVLLDQEPGQPGTLRVLSSGGPSVQRTAEPSMQALTASGGAETTDTGVAGLAEGGKPEPAAIKIAVEGE